MSDIREVQKAAETVLDALRKSGVTDAYVSRLSTEIARLSIPSERLAAVAALCGLSHVKNLGDIYLENIPGYEWPNMVSQLYGECRVYLEKNDLDAQPR